MFSLANHSLPRPGSGRVPAIKSLVPAIAFAVSVSSTALAQTESEDAVERGARAFRSCIGCHSIEPGDHRTGPSLAGIVGRRAGSVEGFGRYSEALKESGVVWDRETLDAWLADPRALVPGTEMVFPGIHDARTRRDLIDYLASGSSAVDGNIDGTAHARTSDMPDLGQAPAANRVSTIRYCDDTYRVETDDGQTHVFWEFNLRFKTDSSRNGPPPGTPVLMSAGMMGDRAFVIFADPGDISPAVETSC